MAGESSTDLVATLETKIVAAMDADEAGDLSRAIQLLEQCQTLLSAIPDGRIEEESFTYDRESIERAIANLRRRKSASAGVVTQEVKYERG